MRTPGAVTHQIQQRGLQCNLIVPCSLGLNNRKYTSRNQRADNATPWKHFGLHTTSGNIINKDRAVSIMCKVAGPLLIHNQSTSLLLTLSSTQSLVITPLGRHRKWPSLTQLQDSYARTCDLGRDQQKDDFMEMPPVCVAGGLVGAYIKYLCSLVEDFLFQDLIFRHCSSEKLSKNI